METDFLVVGGGFTGASLAATIARSPELAGRRVLVLEARPGRNPRFNGELIHPTGVDVLDAQGLLGPLERLGGVAVEGFAVVPSDGAAPTILPYAEIPGGRPAGFAIEHHDMVGRLREEAASRPGVEIRYGARVVELLRDGERVVGVRTEGGEEVRAGVTLVAEGRHSRLRKLAGIEDEQRLVSYTAAVLVENTELPHTRYGHIFLDAPGPILAYPIDETEASSGSAGGTTVRMCIDVPSDLLEANKGPALRQLLVDRYAPRVPRPLRDGMLAALAKRPPEVAANHAIYTRRCVGPGVALVGESGGCSHPLTAGGMTICLTDIRALVEELGAAVGEGAVLGDRATQAALERYQGRRYRFVRAREVLADALYEVFRGSDEGARAIRGGIIRYWQGSERARAASMALLSGADSRLQSFLGEYLRVVARSTSGALAGTIPGNGRTVGDRLRSLGGLAGKSLDKMKIVARHVRAGTMR